MRSNNTFGLHFVLRPAQKGSYAIYARIVVNGTRCELALKRNIAKKDWDTLPSIIDAIVENGTFQMQHVRNSGLDDNMIDGYARSWSNDRS